MPTPIIDALKDDSDLTMHTHTEADLGATLDNRYVNVTGDTMTGALVIAPTANGTAILDVKTQAGASVFKVNTTDLRSETTGAVMAIESASGYSQFNHANALTSAWPRAFFNIFGGESVANAALYVASGNATGSTQIPAFLGISTNTDVKQADSIQAVHYLTTSAYKIVTTKGESGSNTVPVHIGGTSSSLTDSKVIISTNDDPIMSVSRTISVGTSTSFVTLYAVSTTYPSALFWKSDQPFRLGTATSTAGGGFSEKMRINSSGNVGIGTTAPGNKLEISGTAVASELIPLRITNTNGDNGSGVSMAFQAVGGTTITGKIRNVRVGSSDYSMLMGPLNNFDALAIRTNGNVGIGTTAPAGRLHINGTADDQQLIVEAHSTQTNNIVEIHDSSSNVLISFNGVGGAVFNEQGSATADFRVESDTEANMLFVDANANTDGSVYLGGTTNGIEIKKGGDLTLLGTAKYERHVQIPAMANGLPANQPAEVDFFTAGGLQFASAGAQYAYCQWEIPDDWDGTDIVFEIDWFPDSGAISGTDAVRWTVEYRSIAEGELINQGTSVTVDNGVGGDTADYAQYETKHSRFTLDFDNANQPLTNQDHVYFKISRDTSVANDFAGTVTVSAYEIIYQSKGLPSSN